MLKFPVLALTGLLALAVVLTLSPGRSSVVWAGSNCSPSTAAAFFDDNGHSYQAYSCSSSMSWPDAKAFAESVGGYLATITDSSEQSFVHGLVGNASAAHWLGGFQDPGDGEPADGWEWVTGESWSYTNWGSGEPNDLGNEDYLEFNGNGDGKWNDTAGPHNALVVEWDIGHFACYEAKGDYEKRSVYIQDQFLKKYAKTTILEPVLVCSFTNKELDAYDPYPDEFDALLVCYRERPPFSVSETVKIYDQFWSKEVRPMTPTSTLCLPSASPIRGVSVESFGWVEELIDHYRCYTLRRERFKEIDNVGLENALGAQIVKVKEPVSLCNPAVKSYEDYGILKLIHPDAHLVCYSVKVKQSFDSPMQGLSVYNQFGPQYLHVKDLVQLCNPASKFHKKAF